MALKGQFGYVFPDAPFKTGAHELGHGVFGLEHPFARKADENKTNFLMDYASDNMLWHNDWKQINDPKFRLYLFQGDSEGESKQCEEGLKNIAVFLSAEKVNYLKLLASELGETGSIAGKQKTYTTSVYDEENGNLKIIHYKNWDSGSPKQNLFLIQTKDATLSAKGIRNFWISYTPNTVDGTANTIDVTVYFKEPVPGEKEPFCTVNTKIPKGITTQEAFADAMGQMVFYSALGLPALEIMSSIETLKCIKGFTIDLSLQLTIFALIEKYQHPSESVKMAQLIKDVSLLNASTSCVTAAFIENCGAECNGLAGAVVGFGDDVIAQLRSGKKLSEVDLSQSMMQSALQGLIAMGTHQLISYGAAKWGKKYPEKLIQDAFEDLKQHPEKFGVGSSGVYLENLVRYKQLFKEGKIAELFSELKKTTVFPKMGNTRVRNQTDLLAEYKAKYGQNAINYPYSSTNPVTDFELVETGYFVRLFNNVDQDINRRWVFRIEDLRKYKTIEEMMEKLALPSRPLKIALVEVPAGTSIRKSTVGSQDWGNGLKQSGGGVQYELSEFPKEWFENLSTIEEFFK